MAIEARVYDPTNTTYLGSLPLSLAREWRDELMAPGFGSLSVPVRSADDYLLASDRVVRFRHDGTDRFAMICSDGDQTLVEAQEESGQLTSWSGPGLLQWFEESVVFPELGVGRLSASERVFNFASTSYDDSAWTAPVVIKRQGDVDTSPYPDAPDDFPDEDAYWIWTRASDPTPPGPLMPVGSVFFRRWFTVASQTDAVMAVACDDGYEVWLDGERIGMEERAFLWGRTTEYGMVLDAGVHLVAVRATNIERDSVATNGAAFLLSILAATAGGNELNPAALVRTDVSWVCLDYPDPWPTMSPGEIMNVLLDEANAVGELTWITRGFTDDLDSNGVWWWNRVDLAVPVGSSFLDVLLALGESSIDFELDPSSNTLRLFNKGGMGQDRTYLDFLTRMDDPEKGDWVQFTLVAERALAKRALTQLDNETWAVVDSFAGGRPTTGFARLGTATSPMQVERVMTGWFELHGYGRIDFAGQLNPTPGKLPYADFGLADTIMVPGWRDETPFGSVKAQVTSIAITELQEAASGEIDGTQLLAIEGRFLLGGGPTE